MTALKLPGLLAFAYSGEINLAGLRVLYSDTTGRMLAFCIEPATEYSVCFNSALSGIQFRDIPTRTRWLTGWIPLCVDCLNDVTAHRAIVAGEISIPKPVEDAGLFIVEK